MADQQSQVESLRGAYRKLEDKLAEARAKCDLLIAQDRRSRSARKVAEAGMAMQSDRNSATFDRMRRQVHHGQAASAGTAELVADKVDEQLDLLERDDRIDRLLAELKARRQ